MRRHVKRAMSVILTAAMLITAVPTGIAAEEPVQTESVTAESSAPPAADAAAQQAANEAAQQAADAAAQQAADAAAQQAANEAAQQAADAAAQQAADAAAQQAANDAAQQAADTAAQQAAANDAANADSSSGNTGANDAAAGTASENTGSGNAGAGEQTVNNPGTDKPADEPLVPVSVTPAPQQKSQGTADAKPVKKQAAVQKKAAPAVKGPDSDKGDTNNTVPDIGGGNGTEGDGNATEGDNNQQKTVEVIWADSVPAEGAEILYSGNPITVSASYKAGDVEKGLIVSILKDNASAAEVKNAGNYKLTVSFATPEEKEQYALTGETTREFKITKAEAAITWTPNEDSVAYAAKEIQVSASYTNKGGSSVSLKVTVADGKTVKNVDSYSFTAEFADDDADKDNYTLTGSTTKTLTITKRGVIVTPKDSISSKAFGDEEPVFNNTGFNYEVVGDDADKPSAETVQGELANVDFSRANGDDAGTYVITATMPTGADPANNYTLDMSGAEFEITPKEVTAVWNPDSDVVYTGADVAVTAKYKDITDTDVELTVTEDDGKIPHNVDEYNFTASFKTEKEKQNYKLSDSSSTKKIKITKCKVTITPKEAASSKYYGKTDDPDFDYGVTVDGDVPTAEQAKQELANVDFGREPGEDAGTYAFTATMPAEPDDPANDYTIVFAEGAEFTINKLPITITADDQEVFYGEDEALLTYGVEIDETADTDLDADAVHAELDLLDPPVLSREKGATTAIGYEEANEDGIAITVNTAYDNYDVTAVDGTYRIWRLPISITAVAKEKFYGKEEDPELEYDVEIGEEAADLTAITEGDIRTELGAGNDILERETGEKTGFDKAEPAGEYEITQKNDLYANYDVDYTSEWFKIKKLPITITPKKDQEKFYGEKDPTFYEYAASWSEDTDLSEGAIKSELQEEDEGKNTNNILKREDGEDVSRSGDVAKEKTYDFQLKAETYRNYEVTLAPEVFTIKPLALTVSAESITSREGGFTVSTPDLGGEGVSVDSGIVRKVVIVAKEADFPADDKGIRFEKNLEKFIPGAGADKGFAFGGGTDKDVAVSDYTYSTVAADGATYQWPGKLPAGTTLHVYVYGDKGVVSSNTATVKVTQTPVSLAWSTTAPQKQGTNYLATSDTLSVSDGGGNAGGEYVDVTDRSFAGGHKYGPLGPITFTPVADDSGSTHNVQTASAVFMDVLNLAFSGQQISYIYDDKAFEIPSSNIQFHNRDKEITINLPETGTITNVTIPGAEVALSGAEGQQFTLNVSWSGTALIPHGSGIQVTYTDQSGNEGHGSSSAAISTVSTPVRVQIRPDVNSRGYLTGRGTLIVSGTACSCEPLNVTVAGMSKSTNVAAKEVWADENGSFEVAFDMNRQALPERTDFTVSASYTDVIGPDGSLTARYDEYANAAAVASPVFRAMPFLSGMAELDSTVILMIGEKAYELNRDSFGHFDMSNVDMMMPGDTFTVRVVDIAGNENNAATFTVPEPNDPVSGGLAPSGKYYFDGGEDSSAVYAATPVRASAVSADGMQIPLLFGGSYKAGTITITKTGNGLQVQSELDPEVFVNEDNYSVTGGSFYVYTSEPTVEQLRNHSGAQEYQYGDTVPASETDTLWIVDGRTLQMTVSDVSRLATYNFSAPRDEDPEKTQEYNDYLAFQEFGTRAEPLAAVPVDSQGTAA